MGIEGSDQVARKEFAAYLMPNGEQNFDAVDKANFNVRRHIPLEQRER
jgi:hypothetical protein